MESIGKIMLATLLAGSCMPAIAMAAEDDQAAGSGESVGVEDIIVTAQRRESNLQDTPIAITALSSTAMEARGVKNIGNLENFAPNLQINQGRADGGGSTSAITIRGVGQNDPQFPNDPGVGMYVDGVYSARTYGGLIGLLDIERIEVLRGPQGTLFGRNTIGGAVNIVTTPPSQEFGGHASLLYGSYNRLEAKASLNVPLIADKLAMRVSAGFTRADGLGKQLTTGVELSNENRKVFRIALRATPSDDVTIDLVADYTRQRQNGSAGKLLTTVPSDLVGGLFNGVLAPVFENPALGLPADSIYDDRWLTNGRYDNYGTAPMADNLDAGGGALTVEWKASDALTIKSITAGRAYKTHIAGDADFSPYSIIATNDRQQQEQYSQELQFYGNLAGGRLRYLLGLYYFKEIARDRNQVTLVPASVNLGPPPGGPGEISQNVDLNLNATNYAIFGQIEYDIVDDLTITVGLRENHENKTFSRYLIHPVTNDPFVPYEVLEKSWNSFTPHLGLTWKATDSITAYYSFAKGFKGGGWNPRPTSASAGIKPFEPETITTHEAGLKTQWLDRRLTLNMAAFYSRYKNIQLPIGYPSPVDGVLVTDTQNAGESEMYGFEAELSARPVPEASIQIGYGYFHNKYVSIVPSLGPPTVTFADKLPDAPAHTLNIGADYRFDLGESGSLTFRGDASYRSKVFKDPLNTPSITQPGFWLASGRITWASADDRFTVQVFGNNLFDKHYLAAGLNGDALGAMVGFFGRPREFGIQGGVKF